MNELEVQKVISLPLVCTRGVIVFPSQDIIIDCRTGKNQYKLLKKRSSIMTVMSFWLLSVI